MTQDTPDQKGEGFIPDDVMPDLTNCDREPIHVLGTIQPVGFLVATSADWIVTHVSTNTEGYLGRKPEDLLGERFDTLISASAFDVIRQHIQSLYRPDDVEHIAGLSLTGDERLYDLTLHVSGGDIVVEAEPVAATNALDISGQVSAMINRVSSAATLDDLFSLAARQVKAFTGFDRAMIYRFAQDGAGEVVAEAREDHLEPFLNLHYPASDIPAQARVLYKRNLVRSICDVDMKTVDIIPRYNPSGEPLDLSMSVLRAVSPIHLEYLSNMGVGASFSISIIVEGELWGLIACHHYSPRHLDSQLRSMAELYGKVLSLNIERKERDRERQREQQARRVHDRLMSRLTGRSSLVEQFSDIASLLGEVIEHDGIGLWLDGECYMHGKTPSREEFGALVKFLNRAAASRIYATHEISAVYERGADFTDRAAGLLAIPVSRTPRDYIVLFRQEVAKSVTWAGSPEKPVTVGPNGARLTPRKSFEAWQETVTGQSAPWPSDEMTAAEAIRVTFLEVVLRMSDAAEKERARSSERQELLIAELNHRVRNILNLIKGLVNQTRRHGKTVDNFAETISGRIQALARAHDQITAHQWGPGSFHELLMTEAQAYAVADQARLDFHGPNVMFEPAAFTTMSLVIHELMTNSMKHGALSDSTGKITVTVKPQDNDSIEILWRESGGPPVQEPSHKGFGSTIIERSIPFELNGEVDIAYRLGGLEARLWVPAMHIADILTQEESVALEAAAEAGATPTHITGTALVVEDNMVIALDAEDMLRRLGAEKVTVKTNCAEALNEMERAEPSFAVLDINLGNETTQPVAEALRKRGIPFIFATGYGDSTEITQAFPDSPVISKPYMAESLADGLSRAGIKTSGRAAK